ncbi:DMT family transporter [Marivita sp. S6314]|uniref:DMT family transporter n=1 Tax=Marivita sp. S6314 TaxID=2926406 RepID=UPI001FF5A646|nr:DMT family transporter [Marivita sp. S6314]MCK0150151.1 DMT family transporter [Marivita sp. S6314]
MIGEIYALLAAAAYGVAGVAIAKGKAGARGDNGVFLSVLATAVLSGVIWVLWGSVPVRTLVETENLGPIGVFVLAGLMSTVFGRMFMFRATEQTGPVMASLLRRLTPVFGLPLGYVVLSELPDVATLAGASMVMAAVIFYLTPSKVDTRRISRIGIALGVGSALAYALAYTLRSAALVTLPDAALGTCIGALAGVVWIACGTALRRGGRRSFQALLIDRNRWHMLAAFALSAGQFLQFLALKSTSVVSVATLGTLEVFFTALILRWATGQRPVRLWRLVGAGGVALAGTAIMLA